ncbi:hypothetical protein niasHS_012750 [Heterodera schachtii]|uniref:ATPase AAA-type core domain-containing protein n=1 Tax=Heterodera schachtii TaxID=97005 RepID=A0ABD2I7X1_HETSC
MFSNLALYREFDVPPLYIEKNLTAHEIGHAMIAVLDRDATPLRYVTKFFVTKGQCLLREPGHHVCCQLPKALVLYGLSGIGKTHIAKTIAREANCRFVEMVAMSENLLLHSSSGREMTVDGTFGATTFYFEKAQAYQLPEVVQQLKEHISLLHEPGRHVLCQLPKALLLYGM